MVIHPQLQSKTKKWKQKSIAHCFIDNADFLEIVKWSSPKSCTNIPKQSKVKQYLKGMLTFRIMHSSTAPTS